MASTDPFWVDYQSGSLFDLKSVMAKLKADMDVVQNSLSGGKDFNVNRLEEVKEEVDEEAEEQHPHSLKRTTSEGDSHWLDYQSGNLFDLKSVVEKLSTEAEIAKESDGQKAALLDGSASLTKELSGKYADHFSSVLSRMSDDTTPSVFKFTAQFLDTGAQLKPTTDEIQLNGINDAGEPFERDVLRIFKSQRKKNEFMSCVHELLERAASMAGDLPALISDESSTATVVYTYKTLNAAATRLANVLHGKGVRRGDVVAVMLPTDSTYIAVCLSAVLKAGAAVCPIEANLNPANMKQYKLTDTHAKVVLTTSPFKDCSEYCANVILLDSPEYEVVLKSSMTPAPAPLDSNEQPVAADVSFVIYTSGSTGRPKGVEVQHQNMIQYTASVLTRFRSDSREFHTRQFNLTPTTVDNQERISTALLFGFDAFLNAYLLSLSLSAAWVVLRRETIVSGELAERLLPAKLTFLHSLPSLMRTLSPGQLPTLKYVEVGGEALPKDVFQAWAVDRANQDENVTLLVNSYGPTETTITSSRSAVVRNDVLTVGRALPGYRQRVFISEGTGPGNPVVARPARIGEVGEVYVAGAGVARGYLNRPEVTEKVFVTLNDGERWYRTGDEGKHIDDSGRIELFGRIDFQVKIRGHRVELGEIEAVMATHKCVKEIRCAMVVPVTGVEANQSAIGDSNKVLCAFIILHKSNGAEDEENVKHELDEACKKQLPEYMVPQHYLFMEGILPQSAAGKLDVSKLPRPKIHTADLSAGPLWTPTNPFANDEESCKVAEIWTTSVTGFTNDPSGSADSFKFLAPHANFLDLGGNSLAAALIVSKLRNYSREFYNSISVVDIYKYKTIAQFVAHAALQRRLQGGETNKTSEQTASDNENKWVDRYRLGTYFGLVPRSPAEQAIVSTLGFFFQTIWLALLFSISIIQGFAPLAFYYLTVYVWKSLPDGVFFNTSPDGFLFPTATAFFCVVAWIFVSQFAMIALCIILKWVIVGKYQVGRFRLDSWYGIRKWAVSKAVSNLAPMKMMNGTPAIIWFYRALGASIHHSVDLNCGNLNCDFDLLTIGDGTVIEDNCDLNVCQQLPHGYFEAGRVTIGDLCTIRQFSNIGCKSKLGNGVTIRPQSYFTGTADDNTVWEGMPSRQVKDSDILPVERVWDVTSVEDVEDSAASNYCWFLFCMAFYSVGVLVICLQEVFPIILQLVFVFNLVGPLSLFGAIVLCPLVVLAWTPFDVMLVVAVKWIVNGFVKMQPGVYKSDSWLVIRQWLVELMVSRTHKRVNPISHSIIDVWFARAMGAVIPETQGVLITSWGNCNFDMVSMEKFAYLSAEVVAAPIVRRAGGYVTLGRVHFGCASLIGHLAYVAAEVDETVYIPDRCKLGAHVSIASMSTAAALEPRLTAFGSPPVFIPSTSTTLEPLPTKGSSYWGMCVIFLTRIPHFAIFKLFETWPSVLILGYIVTYIERQSVATILANPYPLGAMYIGLLVASKFVEPLILALVSWLLVCGKQMTPGRIPLWYSWERYVTGNYQLYLNTLQEMLDPFKGSLWAIFYYKAAGAHISWNSVGIGSDLYIDDPHLTSVGSNCSFGASAAFTSHTADAEGGYLEFNRIQIGNNVTLGPYTSALRGTVIEDGAMVLCLTKPLPNEFISGENNWIGYPMISMKPDTEEKNRH